MSDRFKHIGLMGKMGDPKVRDTLLRLQAYIHRHHREILLEENTATLLDTPDHVPVLPLNALSKRSDLVIVVGGDGTLLRAARTLAASGVPLLGINLGRLGFLVDVSPDDMQDILGQVFAGDYEEEQRCLLHTQIGSRPDQGPTTRALNDVVIHKWNSVRMIEFETYIDGHFVNAQRSDGLIVSTPTGSTAYALSGGGPLLHPSLNALVLVSICPHTLSNRPIVISGDSVVEIHIASHDREHVRVSCDGQSNLTLSADETVRIQRDSQPVRLLHPRGHDHYQILRAKLGWGEHPTSGA